MKKAFRNILAFLALGTLLGACEENAIIEKTEYVTSGADIKFSVAAQDAPMVNFYLNGQKVTAKTPSNGRIVGLAWRDGALANAIHPANYGYVNVPAGSYTLSAIDTTTIAGTTNLKMNEVLKTNIQLNEKERYTAYLVGQGGNYEFLTVKDEIPPYDFSKSYLKFVNAMAGAPGKFTIKAVGTSPVTDTVVIASKVSFKEATNYVTIPPGTYNIAVFLEGKSTAYTTWTSGNIQPGRTYTFFTRGNYIASPTTVNRQLMRDR
ncbi:DUF4397 domain-containing protein [Rufibacter glacialis]|uniref:DUF4397 domain-containing protein n=1 Tax=Rufibacter glacialis TaxID=1259555 RepID=A0A5M8QFN7_9BACT|nr:DUF4397 domain-containing protein [Rufibacter glacialis]KAA6433576.1 DUF4397 domain-containing protein [Rufibacter glacialis]GGK72851.1 hypothetical protein GCM10011405_21280 [Rufibacter glacialis]